MRLSAKLLKNVASVNHYQYEDQVTLSEGQENEFYFQVVDLDKLTYGKDSEALPDHPLRIMTEDTASLIVEFDSVFDGESFEVAATKPFSLDSSIWKVSLTEQQLPKTGNFIFRLTVGSKTMRAVVRNSIRVELSDVGGC